MKRKVCFILAMLLLLLPAALLAVQATEDTPGEWAIVNYTYDPDVEGEEGKSDVLSFKKDVHGKDAKNYLSRYTTLSWDASAVEVYLNNTLCTGGTYYLWKAGEYTVRVKDLASGESVSSNVTMLPVVKMDDQYLSANITTGQFWRTEVNFYPTLICENVDRIEVDMSDFTSGENMATFLQARDKAVFGEHTLKFVSGVYSTSVYFDIHACTVENGVDEETGKNCLILSVGDFGEDFTVYLDGVETLTPGVHHVTGVGQHTITAKQGNRSVSNVSPAPRQLNLQVKLWWETLTLNEPKEINLAPWDATFYVDGELIEGPVYRFEHGGEHVLTAYNKYGEQIQNAFLVQEVGAQTGDVYTELVVKYNNANEIYAIVMIVPAVAMAAAVIFFFVRRRRIV